METTGNIEVHIESGIKEVKITPSNYDIREIDQVIRSMDVLLSDEKHHRPEVTYELQPGSVKHIFRTAKDKVAEFSGLLALIISSNSLEELSPSKAEIFSELQNVARKKNYKIGLTSSFAPDKTLFITKDTNFSKRKNVWYETPMYFYGKLLDAGGKVNSNIHLDTEDYGYITIRTSREVISQIKGNPLYREFAVLVNAKQDAITGEIDMNSFELVEFIDYTRKFDKEYIDNLIEKASDSWKGVDADEYLCSIRGRGEA